MSEGQKHLLIVDDENALREAIAERLADHGFVVEQAASGEAGAPAARGLRLRHPDHRPAAAGHRRPRRSSTPPLERYPDIIAHRHHRLRHREGRGRSDQAGRRRLHHQAVPVRRAAARASIGARAAAAEIGERVPAIAARGALPDRRARRPAAASMRELFQLLETVAATVEHGPDHGRDRHRQGARRARDSPQQPAAREPLRRDQLQRDSRDAARGGAVRPRARRVHRRGRRRGRAGSSRRTRARCSSTKSGR